MAFINSDTWLVKTHEWGGTTRWNTNSQSLQPNHEAVCGHLSCYLFFSLCVYLWLQHEASYMRKLPMIETTVDTKRISFFFFFYPCSTVRAVDYEILWSILSPQASVNISWHMGERNPHSLRLRLPSAKISSTTPLHSKRDNNARRCRREQLS